MGWGVHDYPEPPPEKPPIVCDGCGEPIGEDGAWRIDGEYLCRECADRYIDDNFSTWELAEALDIPHYDLFDLEEEEIWRK